MEQEKPHHHCFPHHKEDKKPVDGAVACKETSESTTVTAVAEPTQDHERKWKEVKSHELLGEAAAAGAFALYEKQEAKKDPEHAQKHKLEEEVGAAAAVAAGGDAIHEHHQKKKEAEKEEKEAEGKKKP